MKEDSVQKSAEPQADAQAVEIKIPAIYPALADIMADIDAIGKGGYNQSQKFKFRGIDDVINNVHGIFARHRVFILPMVEQYEVANVITKSGTNMFHTRARVRYEFVSGVDGSKVCTVQVGEAQDSGDKSMNKCMAIALKYALTQVLLIPTEDIPDPDATTPEQSRPMTSAEIMGACQDPFLQQILIQVASARSRDELTAIFHANTAYQKDPMFIQACNTRNAEINIPTA